MKTNYIILLTCIVFLFSCKIEKVSPMSIVGEWKYVGSFSHLADYKCTVCPDFEYDKSIYSLTFNNDNTFNARINLLIGKGTFEMTPTEQSNNHSVGKFSIEKLQILNKPPQTEADTYYMNYLEASKLFLLNTSLNATYDQLQLDYDNNNYLLFVRKK